MSTLDDIAKERQVLAERLAKIDGERETCRSSSFVGAAERVLAFHQSEGSAGRGRRGQRPRQRPRPPQPPRRAAPA